MCSQIDDAVGGYSGSGIGICEVINWVYKMKKSFISHQNYFCCKPFMFFKANPRWLPDFPAGEDNQ